MQFSILYNIFHVGIGSRLVIKMTIEYFNEFIVLVDKMNFSEAADELYISQSTLSKHIISLEKELRITLFDRNTRNISLSDQGKVFLKYAKEIVNTYNTAIVEMQKMSKNTDEPLKIASIPAMPHYNISSIIGHFHSIYPYLKSNITVDDSKNLIDQLKNQVVDVAFIRFFDQIDHALEAFPFAEDELVVILPKNHPLANNDTIQISMLKDEDFLLLHQNTSLYDICIKTCEQGNFKPNIVYTGNRIENILDLIENNMGISLLMRKHIKFYENRDIRIVTLDPKTTSIIYLCKLKRKRLNYNAKLFWTFVESQTILTEKMQ